MLDQIVRIFKPAPAAKPLTNTQEIQDDYRYWRTRVLYSSLIGYALFYFVRKNLASAMPVMERDLGITKEDLGLFLTLHGVFYGLSKFANGFLGDRANARYFMALGLALSAVANIFFGLSGSVVTLGMVWLFNGWFQGMGFPPCARTLTHWFSPSERGRKFALWNTSHSIGAALVLILCSQLAVFNWRLCFFVPSALALIGVFFLLNRLRDTPASLGLPPVEHYMGETTREGPAQEEDDQTSWREFLMRYVFCNPMIWVISFANFFVYTVRYAILDWGPTMMKEAKFVKLQHTGWYIAGYETAGIIGMLVSGWLMDKLFRGRGGRACFFYMIGCTVCVWAFWKLPPNSTAATVVLLCAAGFFIYGPQCLVGVIAANLATKRAAATAIGLTGFFGYLSGVLSGWGMGKIVDKWGWDRAFQTIIGAGIAAAFCFIFSWNACRAPQTAAKQPSSSRREPQIVVR